MNLNTAIRTLFETFRPNVVETIRTSRKHPNGKIHRERPATSITRRPYFADGLPNAGQRAEVTIAELIDTLIIAHGLEFDRYPNESPVGRALRLAAAAGVIILKRDKNKEVITKAKSDIPVGAWLVADFPFRKTKKSKAAIEAARKALLAGVLSGLDLMPGDDTDPDTNAQADAGAPDAGETDDTDTGA